MSERIIFTDSEDNVIGAGPREEAWSKGIYVRVVRVILRDEKGRLLSQRRSYQKKTYPNCWTDSASGHVDVGESYDTAAARELMEELGISADLNFVGKFATTDYIGANTINEFNAIYESHISSSTHIKMQEEEVSEVKWFELNEFKSLIESNPEQFTLGIRQTLKRYY